MNITLLEYEAIKRQMKELEQKAIECRAEAAKFYTENNQEKAIECMDRVIHYIERVSQMMNDLLKGNS